MATEFLLVLVAVAFLVWRWKKKPGAPLAPLSSSTPGTVSATMIQVDQAEPTPRFLREASATFDQKIAVWYQRDAEHIDAEHLKPQPGNDPATVGRMLGAFIQSAAWERSRRGYEHRDDLDRAKPVYYRDEGVVIERLDSGHGGARVIVGYDIEGPLPYAEFQEAIMRRVAAISDRWRGQYAERPFAALHERDRSNINFVPLFRLKIREIVEGPTSAADPLAPPSTEKGGARFAWPFD